MISFLPFKNESDTVTIGDLKIENREDRIAIYGALAIGRDRAGLAGAKALMEIFDRIIKEIEDGGNLPRMFAAAEDPAKAKNPFGQA